MAAALCLEQHLPRGGDQPEAAADENIAGQMKGAQVRIASPADEVVPKVAIGVTKRQRRETAAQPARE